MSSPITLSGAGSPAATDAITKCIVQFRDYINPPSFDAAAADQLRGLCENTLAGRYRLQTLETGQKIYENQLFENNVIMWMVVFITLTGVVLAGVQLWATYMLVRAGKGVLADGGEMSYSHDKLVVKSSVVGVIILALSFAFFAVYVLYVYRITDVPGVDATASVPQSTAGAEQIPKN